MPETCPACGAVNPEDSRFCQSCGTDLTAPPAPAVPPSGPVATQPTQAAPSYAPVAPTQPQAGGPAYPPVPPSGSGPAYPPVAAPGSAPAWPAAAWGTPAGGPPAGRPPGPGGPAGSAVPPGKRGPGFRTIAIGVGGALVLAVVVGLIVPKLFSHHKTQTAAVITTKTKDHTPTPTTVPTAPATTQAPTPTTVAPTPTTAAPTPTTATPTPTTAPGTSGTSGTSGTTGTSGSGGGGGQKVSNGQVQVTLSPGWSVNSKSSSTLLILNGPNSTSTGLHSETALPATTLQSVVASLESSTEQLGTGGKVCSPVTPTTIPGGIPGEDFGVCVTTTAQGAAANPIEVVYFVALKQVGTGRRLYVVELVFPQAIPSASFKADYGPILNSVQWATT